jgi:hypothetical protein
MLCHIAFPLTVATALLTGCSSIIRGKVDTQPRVMLSEDAYRDPAEIVNGRPVLYEPRAFEAIQGDALDVDLRRLAPLLVQGFQHDRQRARYEYWSDGIGQPTLTAAGDALTIDTQTPVIYARVERCRLDEQDLKQLVYAFWYPERPVGSIEKGDIDGGILRITLDDQSEPIVFEYSQPCGCFHGVFVSSALERRARDAGLRIEKNRLFAVEPPLTGEGDWVVRDLVDVRPGARPVLYMSAGKHFCEAIRFANDADLRSPDAQEYVLQPYEALSAAPRHGGGETASIFDERGLVIGAKRWQEEIVLGDLDHPGWPRHLDAMLIHWDHDRWSDPTLIQRRLRIGSADDGGRGAVALNRDRSTSQEPFGAIADGRVLLLFTNRACAGCRIAKSQVMGDARVQEAIAPWEYRVIETGDIGGANLAAALRVTVVPMLVGIVGGKELFRTEDLQSPDAVLAFIRRTDTASAISP